MSVSTVTANAFLDGLNANLSFKLHTADSENGANEVVGGSYSAQTATFGSAANKQNSNTNIVTFSGMPAVTVTHGSLYDGATQIFYGPLSQSFTVGAGESLQFGVGEITNVIN